MTKLRRGDAPLLAPDLPEDYLPPRSEQSYFGRPEPTLGEETAVAYLPEDGLLSAANAALVLGAPLLLTGDPGCGKSHFAFAAARALAELAAKRNPAAASRPTVPLVCQIRSDSRARDLLYSFDAVQRFGDAQAGGAAGLLRAQDPRHYVELMPLGRALVSKVRRVVLIDEIDKAPRDLPNDLLHELDVGDFTIAELAERKDKEAVKAPDVLSHDIPVCHQMRRPEEALRPLVVITSNAERQLPDAFLRRCVFYHIPFPDRKLLQDIIRAHCPDLEEGFLDSVLHVFSALREVSPPLRKQPGTAELLHFARALGLAYPGSEAKKIHTFAEGLKAARGPVRWDAKLPALGCLVKLREDQERLLAGA